MKTVENASKSLKKLRCAVIGAGRISWEFHLPQLAADGRFELAAIVDPLPERQEEVKRQFRVPQSFSDAGTMLQTVHPDLTVIASPTAFHKSQVLLAFQYGSDVFCDKPAGLDYEEVKIMFEAAKEQKRKLMVFQPHRLSGECLTAAEILKSGKLGEIWQIERHVSNFAFRDDWQSFRKNGGGMLLNYGAHYVDELLYLMQEKVRHAKCELRTVLSRGDAEDVVKIMLTLDSGKLLELDVNQAAALPLDDWRICGRNGTAVCRGTTWNLRYFDPSQADIPASANTALAATGRQYPHQNLPWVCETLEQRPSQRESYYQYCYDFYSGKTEAFVKPEETLEIMRVLQLCRENNDLN